MNSVTVVFNVTFILYYNNSYFIITQASKRLCNNNNIKYLATNHLRKSSISCRKLHHFGRKREMKCRRARPPCKENTFPVTKAAPRGHLHEERAKSFTEKNSAKSGLCGGRSRSVREALLCWFWSFSGFFLQGMSMLHYANSRVMLMWQCHSDTPTRSDKFSVA